MRTMARHQNDDIVAVQCNLDRIEAQLNFLRATLIELLGDDVGSVRHHVDHPQSNFV